MTARSTRFIQLGRENTAAGTAVSCTTVWAGEANKFENLAVPVFPVEDAGLLAPLARSHVPKFGGRLTPPPAVATFEQINHIFEAGIETDTPAADGSGYIYEYNLPTTAANTIKTYTIEAGDATQCDEVEYCFVSEFKLAGTADQALTMQPTWIGRQLTDATKTASQVVPAVRESILVGKGTVYINDTFASLGVTAVSSTIIGINMAVTTGISAHFTADNGQLYFTDVNQNPASGSIDVTMEYNATGLAEELKYLADTGRFIRFQFNGTALGTAGSTYTTKALRIDCYGKWESFSQLDESPEGNDIVTGKLRLLYDGTNIFANIYVVNELSAVP